MSGPDLWHWHSQPHPGRTLVTLSGELDLSSVDELRTG